MHRFTSEGMEYRVRWGTRTVAIYTHPVGNDGAGASIGMPKEAWERIKRVEITSPGAARTAVVHPADDDDEVEDEGDNLTVDEIVNTLEHWSHRMPARPSEDILRRLGPVLVYNEGWRAGIRETLDLVRSNMPCGASIIDGHHRVNCDLKRGHEGMHEHAKDTTRKLTWSNAAPTHAESYPVTKRPMQ